MTRTDSLPRLRRLTLAFVDPDDEARYADYNFTTAIGPARWAALSGLVVLLLFGYLDYRMFPDHYLHIWIGRGICAVYVVGAFLLTYTPFYRRVMQPVTALGTVACAVLAVWMMHVTRGQPFCGELYVGILICVIFSCVFLRLSFPWAAGSSLAMLGLFLLFTRNCIAEPEFFVDAVYLSLGTISSILGAYSIESHLRRSYWQARQLDEAALQYQRLLEKILPPAIAARLNGGEQIIADYKDEVSVLFADIVGSVETASILVPDELVALLNKVFLEFDGLVAQHGLETIKTIGDGYMVAGNCSRCCPDHVRAIADLALAMREVIAQHHHPDGRPITLRIGIHTGPVIAGVMNLSKLSYDLWGDTVNIASRMESQGVAGAIQVTEDVLRVLGDDYEFQGPFAIDVEGKGKMPVYRLLGPACHRPAGSPPLGGAPATVAAPPSH